MANVREIINTLGKRKIRVFSLFLLCSILAWSVSNLSEDYQSRVDFNLNYANLPDTLLLSKSAQKSLEVKVEATGFQLLYYNISPKAVTLDLSKSQTSRSDYFLSLNILKKQFEDQLAKNIKLVEFENDTLFLDLYQVAIKEVTIKPDIDITLAQNHLLEGKLKIEPEKVSLKGPKREIESVEAIKTSKIRLVDLDADFSVNTGLLKPEVLKNSELTVQVTNVSGTVVKFSEKVFQVPITLYGVPEGFSAKTFPNAIEVVCKASLKRLQEIKNEDFVITTESLTTKKENTTILELKKKPENVYDVRLMQNEVKYILEEQ